MSADFVVDCSVAMSWLFEDEMTLATSQILDRLNSEAMVVPPIWFLEITNTLALAERRGRVTLAKSGVFIAELSKFDFEIDSEPPQRAFSHVLPLCRAHGLTSYDATYLDLAIRRKLPLATLDQPLRKAAKKLGVKLLGK